MKNWLMFAAIMLLWVIGTSDILADSGTSPRFSLSYMPASVHHDSGNYNELHHGLGVYMHLPNGATYGAMRYRNSHDDMSTALSISGETGCITTVIMCGAAVAYVTGYDSDKVSPPIVPMVYLRWEAVTLVHVPATVTAIQFRILRW